MSAGAYLIPADCIKSQLRPWIADPLKVYSTLVPIKLPRYSNADPPTK
jgi:hypothetical protein